MSCITLFDFLSNSIKCLKKKHKKYAFFCKVFPIIVDSFFLWSCWLRPRCPWNDKTKESKSLKYSNPPPSKDASRSFQSKKSYKGEFAVNREHQMMCQIFSSVYAEKKDLWVSTFVEKKKEKLGFKTCFWTKNWSVIKMNKIFKHSFRRLFKKKKKTATGAWQFNVTPQVQVAWFYPQKKGHLFVFRCFVFSWGWLIPYGFCKIFLIYLISQSE